MYSLMSMRTMARSSSNRNSASARASSVLPTPVGPEEQERADRAGWGPTGRPGCAGWRWRPPRRPRPGRPPGRAGRPPCAPASSTSPSRSRLTGTPVQRLTTSATSSASTSSFKQRRPAWSSARLVGGLLDAALELGDLAVADLGGAGEVAVALEALGLALRVLELLLERPDARRWPSFSACQRAVIASDCSFSSASSSSSRARRSLERARRSPWPGPPARSRAGACGG